MSRKTRIGLLAAGASILSIAFLVIGLAVSSQHGRQLSGSVAAAATSALIAALPGIHEVGTNQARTAFAPTSPAGSER